MMGRILPSASLPAAHGHPIDECMLKHRLQHSDSMPSQALIAIAVGLLATAAMITVTLLIFFRRRFRRLWQEALSLRQDIHSLHREITGLRKQILMNQVSGELRLPALLPSEAGEEIMLYNYFRHKKTGFFIEVGAFNGTDLSNTYFLESLGWHGILIEPDPVLHEQCVRSRPFSQVLNVAASQTTGKISFTTAKGREWLSFSGTDTGREQRILAAGGTLLKNDVPCLPLNTILADCKEPIDILSIDVEGHELSVLSGLDFNRFRPRVILLEQGHSEQDAVIDSFLVKQGYKRALRLGSNSFYIGIEDDSTFTW